MPLNPRSSVSDNILELHTGKTYAKTAAKFGKHDADRQAVAIALSTARKSRASGGIVNHYDVGGAVSPQLMGMMTQPGMPPLNPQQPSMGVAGPSPMMPPPMNMGPTASVMPQPTPTLPPGIPQNTTPGVAPPVNNPMTRPLMARGGVAHRASGGIANFADGGFAMQKGPHLAPPWQQRNEIRGMTAGPIMSTVPGRTDLHNTHVASGSYILPADFVSGQGQGNSLAGMQNLNHLFHMGPYGTSPMGMPHGPGAPRPPKPMGMMHSGGGKGGSKHVGTPTPVVLAGGEFAVPPEKLMEVVHPNLSKAHQIMDAWVIHERKKLRKTLAKLPGPAKD
jgi:hypothetical protein